MKLAADIKRLRIKLIVVAYITLILLAALTCLILRENLYVVLYGLYLLPALLPLAFFTFVTEKKFVSFINKAKSRNRSIFYGMLDFASISILTGATLGPVMFSLLYSTDVDSIVFGLFTGTSIGAIIALPIGFSFGGYFGCRAFEYK